MLSFVMIACAAPHTDVAPIPIDYGGFAGRLRRLCEMGKAAAEGACALETGAADGGSAPDRAEPDPNDGADVDAANVRDEPHEDVGSEPEDAATAPASPNP
jgi:hypothetical protein